MAFNLKLPRLLAKMRWKVKIRDRERVEGPHFTIIHGTTVWRVCLRDGRFLDSGSWNEMPDGLEQAVRAQWQQLCDEWDRMYPHNPIRGDGNDDDADDDA